MSWQSELALEYSLDEERIALLEQLLQLLSSASDRNLTAVTDPRNIVNLHFRDSLSLLRLPEVLSAGKAADIGSGAGFPGLPLAIAAPDKRVTMIEARGRKAEFIGSVIASLGLKNATVQPVRAEEAGRSGMRESFDLALARAVGSIPVVLEYSIPLVAVGGAAVLQRGAREEKDEADAARVAGILGASLDRVEATVSYPGAKNLHIWVFRKDSPTPERFPRRPGIPAKRPL